MAHKVANWLDRFFLSPMLEELPPGYTTKEFLDEMFSVRQRQIVMYRAKRGFVLPGKYLQGGVHPIPGWNKDRKVRGRDIVWIRKDERETFYTLEHNNRTFRLVWDELRLILNDLKKAADYEDIETPVSTGRRNGEQE